MNLKNSIKTTHLLLLFCLALWLAFSLRTNADYDIGFHLKAGQWIAQNDSIPQMDRFTTTAQGRPYIDVQWLYQVTLYGLYKMAGYGALTLFNAFLIGLLFVLLLQRLRLLSSGEAGAPFFLTLFVLGIEHRFLLRPEVLSWLLLTATLLILDGHYWGKGGRLKFLPLLQLVWANVEGLFVLGWVAMAAYGLGILFRDKKVDKPLLKWSAVSVLATLVNPYFLKGTLFPFILQTRLDGSSLFKQTVGELASPWSSTVRAIYPDMPAFLILYKVLFVLTILAALVCVKKVKLHEWLLLASFGWLSATALRNIPFFLLVVVPILARLVPELKGKGWVRFASQACLALFLAASLVRVYHNAYYVANDNRAQFGLGISEKNLPVKAAQFLIDNSLDGRLVNSLGFGGWLEWRGFQTSIDGRLEVVGEDLYREYTDSVKPGRLLGLVQKDGASIVVYDHRSMPLWTEQMMEANWRLVYFDENSAVYLKPGYRPDLPEADFESLPVKWAVEPFSPEEVDGLTRISKVSWPRLFEEGLERPQPSFRDYLYLGDLAFHYQHYAVAEGMYLEGLKLAQGREYLLYTVLARDYIRTEQWQRAGWCLESALTFGRDTRKLEAELAQVPVE